MGSRQGTLGSVVFLMTSPPDMREEGYLLCGVSHITTQVINALVSLHEVTPDELKGTTMIRSVGLTSPSLPLADCHVCVNS